MLGQKLAIVSHGPISFPSLFSLCMVYYTFWLSRCIRLLQRKALLHNGGAWYLFYFNFLVYAHVSAPDEYDEPKSEFPYCFFFFLAWTRWRTHGAYLDKVVLERIALACHFALDLLCGVWSRNSLCFDSLSRQHCPLWEPPQLLQRCCDQSGSALKLEWNLMLHVLWPCTYWCTHGVIPWWSRVGGTCTLLPFCPASARCRGVVAVWSTRLGRLWKVESSKEEQAGTIGKEKVETMSQRNHRTTSRTVGRWILGTGQNNLGTQKPRLRVGGTMTGTQIQILRPQWYLKNFNMCLSVICVRPSNLGSV